MELYRDPWLDYKYDNIYGGGHNEVNMLVILAISLGPNKDIEVTSFTFNFEWSSLIGSTERYRYVNLYDYIYGISKTSISK